MENHSKPPASQLTPQTIQQSRKFKRGELIFQEGEKSRAMYLVKSGMIRLFMRRGESTVEIETIRPGQIIGELAFLDGNPRSASGEALTDCEVAEISGPLFVNTLSQTPDWLKLLLKTVVSRLRAANNKIRFLESSSIAIDYSDRDGSKKAMSYQYLSMNDFMKVATSLLLTGCRSKKTSDKGIEIQLDQVNRYAHFIMGIPVAKVASVITVLADAGFAANLEESGDTVTYLPNLDGLEKAIAILNSENLLPVEKRKEVSDRGFQIMKMIAATFPSLPKTGDQVIIDLMAMQHKANTGSKRDLFRLDELNELVQSKFISDLNIISKSEVLTKINPDSFMRLFRHLQIIVGLRTLNTQKRGIRAPR